ncbi:MAG: PKD domain-containing protein [Armatimonadetes bacterium]|nr:PKD domain-containing protein [Armatimonadota bacterium]
MRSLAALLLCCLLLLAMPGLGGADATPSPGFGVAFLNNARPVSPSPTGHSTADWEWRPLYVNDNAHFTMPVYPTTVGKLGYWFTASAWKTHLTTACPWSGAGLYLHDQGPSAIWRRYQSTLYHQINNAAIPNPNAVPGYTVADYYYNRYANSGTIPAEALPSNWYLDPFKRMVVESLMNSSNDIDTWGMYDDLVRLFEDCPGTAGASMGAGGTILYFVALACEYALLVSYDEMVRNLEQQAALYRSYFAPAEHNYFSLYDPTQGRVTIVRRKVPNYTVPSGAEASVAPTRNCIGTFSLCSGQAVSSLYAGTSAKTATISETFTTASVPFQLALEADVTNTTSAAKLSGRFQVRVHAPAGGNQPEQWFVCQVAGTPAGQWLAPWAFVAQKDGQAAWNSTTNGTDYAGTNGTNVSTTFATNGQNNLSINWSGELIIRAMDFGVDRLDKLELTVATEAMGGMKSTARVCLQPIFSRNIAEAGPWCTATAGSVVNFSAETGALPSNAQSTSYTWTFPDGGTVNGPNASHTFMQPGIYDVLLKVDPQVAAQAPNKDLFNDANTGFSYDLRRVSVAANTSGSSVWTVATPAAGQPNNVVTGGALSSTDGSVTFSNLIFTANSSSVTATWTTSPVTTSRLNWSVLPPDFVGPPASYQAGSVANSSLTANHQLVLPGRTAGTTYYLQVGGAKPGTTNLVYACGGSQAGLAVTNLRFDASPGKIIASWNTSQVATAKVQYSTSATATPTQQVTSNTSATHHELTITGLTNGRTYYLTVLNTPQGSTTPVVCKHNGTSPWEVKVPSLYSGGSRATDLTCVEYACAIPQAANQYKYQARLSQIAQVRLVRRVLPSGSWVQTAWVSNTRDPNWTLGTVAGKAYEFAIEEHRDNGDTVRSRTWIHVAESAPPPPPGGGTTGGGTAATQSGEATAFTRSAKDGQTVSFPRAFTAQPVILVSAARSTQPLAACAVNNSKTGFRLSLRDTNDQPVTQTATVCCLAFTPGAGGMQGGVAQLGDNANVTFPQAFAAPPVIVCNAQSDGKALLACAVSNRVNGFTLRLRNLSGASVSRAWVQWVAVKCPLDTQFGTRHLVVNGGVQRAGDRVPLTYPQMPATPAILGSAQSGNAYLVGPLKRAPNKGSVGIRSHTNQPANNVWLQWLAAYSN